MRRFRELRVPVRFALLVATEGFYLGIFIAAAWDRLKDYPFVRKWGLLVLAPLVVVLAFMHVVWEARRGRETSEEPGSHPWQMRQILVGRVLSFAQAQFDGGLYAKARKEFQLVERPLQLATEDRAMDVTIEPYYRDLQGPLVILGEAGTGKTTLLYELATVLCTTNESDPIPVPFGLSNWALKEEPLAEWMVSELRRNYGVGPALGRSWVNKVGCSLGWASGWSTGWKRHRFQKRTNVNSGLKQSAVYAAAVALPLVSLAGLASLMPWALIKFAAGPLVIVVAVLLPAVKGGGFCIKNLTMHWVLARAKYIPWNYEAFLYFSVERVLMIRQGGSFRFIHRMLQEHLSAHPPSTT